MSAKMIMYKRSLHRLSGSYPCSVHSARDPSAPIRGEIDDVEKERVWYYRS
ncbi:hypothetical protein BPUM_0874 [Bacillus pumilus SAFR-032]|uniref:Uncharacterized protein n=1 Tax=Bacillus pumilus (strain SAFR-032) TaxID=315750 RepID=A8FBE1_BACP2|nr:hypothetical protein BPUM_0874 [Bacillus pumilus SAFR-032]